MTTVTAINTDIELMAHLIRRAGFSATRDELNRYMEQGYESTVEELLNPKDRGLIPEDIIRRLHMSLDEGPEGAAAKWILSFHSGGAAEGVKQRKLSIFIMYFF